MPWVIAELRGQRVYARADASGQLQSTSGRVEIRYNPNDGRMYRASARNLEVVDAQVLPDSTCGPAEQPDKARKEAAKKKSAGGGRKKSRTASPAAAPATTDARVIAYTDGACSGNPGPAGLGVVLLTPEARVERFEYLGKATNNIAELTAILRAVEELGEQSGPVAIFTDSRYSIGVLQQGWKAKKNQQLIAELREALANRNDVRLHYVKGHAGIELNERADELARRAVESRNSGRDVLPAEPA